MRRLVTMGSLVPGLALALASHIVQSFWEFMRDLRDLCAIAARCARFPLTSAFSMYPSASLNAVLCHA